MSVIDEFRAATDQTMAFALEASDVAELRALELPLDTLGGQVIDDLPEHGRFIDAVDAEWILEGVDGKAVRKVPPDWVKRLDERIASMDFEEKLDALKDIVCR